MSELNVELKDYLDEKFKNVNARLDSLDCQVKEINTKLDIEHDRISKNESSIFLLRQSTTNNDDKIKGANDRMDKCQDDCHRRKSDFERDVVQIIDPRISSGNKSIKIWIMSIAIIILSAIAGQMIYDHYARVEYHMNNSGTVK
jgi:SMC interacting uncharacterized protein involved in chromosome segregation